MLKLIGLIAAFTFTVTAHAHFEIGVYKGITVSNSSCEFEILSVNFKNSLHHPLNERVIIDATYLSLKSLEFAHLPLVDSVAGTVRPKKEVLTTILPNQNGSAAIELIMNENGPAQIIYMFDDYKNPANNRRDICMDLVFQK